MHSRIIALFVCLCVSLWSATARAQSNDPSELFLTGYQAAQKGEKQEAANNFAGALQSFQEASQQLDQITTRFPTWNPSIVKFRSTRIAESIARVQKRVGSGVVPPGAVVDDGADLPKSDTPLDLDRVKETPAKPAGNSTKPVRASTGAPAGGDDAIARISAERKRLMDENNEAQKELDQRTKESEDLKKQLAAERTAKENALAKSKILEARADRAEKQIVEMKDRGSSEQEQIAALQAQLAKDRRELGDIKLDNEARDEVERQKAIMISHALRRAADAATFSKTTEAKVAEADARVAAAEKKAEQAISTMQQKSDKVVSDAQKEITQANKAKEDAIAKLASVTKERDQAREQLDMLKKGNGQVEKLLAENNRLNARLAEADKQIAQYKADSDTKDKLIASLKTEVSQVRLQLADAQKQSATFQTQMVDLKNKLEIASADLTKQQTSNATANAEKKKALEENDILRNIVVRQMKDGARKAQISKGVLADIGSQDVKGRELRRQLEQTTQPFVLTPAERALFKQPIVNLESDQDISAVAPSGTPPDGSNAPAPVAPPLTDAPSDAMPPAAGATPAPKKTASATPEPSKKPEPSDRSGQASATPSGKKPSLDTPASEAIAPMPKSDVPTTPGTSSKDDGSMPSGMAPGMPPALLPLVQRGKDEFERGDFRTAEKTYEEILRKVPNNLYALSNLGVVRYRSGKYKLAEESFKKAIAIAPEDGFSHTTLGIVYYVQNKYDDAVNELTKALAINPKNATAHNYLGITASQKGWPEAAQKELETAVLIDPGYADAWFNLAVVYATRQPPDKENAQRCYKKAVELGAEADPSLEQIIK